MKQSLFVFYCETKLILYRMALNMRCKWWCGTAHWQHCQELSENFTVLTGPWTPRWNKNIIVKVGVGGVKVSATWPWWDRVTEASTASRGRKSPVFCKNDCRYSRCIVVICHCYCFDKKSFPVGIKSNEARFLVFILLSSFFIFVCASLSVVYCCCLNLLVSFVWFLDVVFHCQCPSACDCLERLVLTWPVM